MNFLRNVEDLDKCLANSAETSVFVYKHSTVCPISARAHRQLTEFLSKAGPRRPEAYMVNVIENRALSKEVEARLSVRHASPQLILIRDARALWSASHGGITAESIEQAVARLAAQSGQAGS